MAAGVGTSGSTLGGGIVEKCGKGINLSTNLEISEESIKGQFVYKPNFAYSDNTLFTSLNQCQIV